MFAIGYTVRRQVPLLVDDGTYLDSGYHFVLTASTQFSGGYHLVLIVGTI